MVQHEPDGPLEPILILVPAPRTLDLAFPFTVVEGKAYSTGQKIFEAENQAAVFGACALKIQLDLDSLVNSGTTSSGALPTSSNTQPSLFFKSLFLFLSFISTWQGAIVIQHYGKSRTQGNTLKVPILRRMRRQHLEWRLIPNSPWHMTPATMYSSTLAKGLEGHRQ